MLFGIILSSISLISTAQDHDHDHSEHEHIHTEIATGGGLAFSTESSGIAPAFHLHGIKGITPHFGLGLGYEIIIGEELHQSIAALINFKPYEFIDINLGPGIVLPADDEAATLVLNAEFAFPYHIGEVVHLGPLLDLGYSKHGLHLIAGVHIGFDL